MTHWCASSLEGHQAAEEALLRQGRDEQAPAGCEAPVPGGGCVFPAAAAPFLLKQVRKEKKRKEQTRDAFARRLGLQHAVDVSGGEGR